ncbi:MAG TPA: tRNA 2-selenouridine(34) synthase MnmH [Burkholderiales bacterium]|nr:tRNA 2-selenouridine(34) synthase MnmH [Burkholderiales bacterium]
MHPLLSEELVNVTQLREFDELIDVRSPTEFAEDHIPGAINCPVLDDTERKRIGTIYKQVSNFEAKKIGAALVARNIARHIEQIFITRKKDWRPLIYCWRGGNRSAAMVHVLEQVGWHPVRLRGGYKSYRIAVVEDLIKLPMRFQFRVICGPTGSGKSRLLKILDSLGAQVLDLEQLAAHRGSVLGSLPDTPQPSQKMFESLIWTEFHGFNPKQPVYVESESKKIGNLHVPDTLLEAMWCGRCIRIEADLSLRGALLKEEYQHLLLDPETLLQRIELLSSHYGHDLISSWKRYVTNGQWDALVMELLKRHYDPAYNRSIIKHYPNFRDAPILYVKASEDAEMRRLAQSIIATNK